MNKPACLPALCTWYPHGPEETIESPGTDGCEPPYGYWKSNPDSSKEQSVLLTPALSLQQEALVKI